MVDVRVSAVSLVVSKELTVAQAAACLGVSRQTMQRYVTRYREQGPAGLVDRSRRPHSSPALLPAWVEDEILRVRKEHPRWGARKIRWLLAQEPQRLGGFRVPAASTVHQALVRHGEALGARGRGAGQPWRRFRAAAPNVLWQIDAWAAVLDAGQTVWVCDMIDDYCRFLLASRVMTTVTSENAWQLLVDAVAAYGMPVRLLTDNNLAFTGRAHATTVSFERMARAAGIELTHSRPWHPQTCGKIERSHGTVEDWLADQPPAGSAQVLQAQLDRHRDEYNHLRPHDELDGAVPAAVYRRGEPVLLPLAELDVADPYPPGAVLRTVSRSGSFNYNNDTFDLATRFAGITVGLVHRGARLHVYYGAAEIATFILGLPGPDSRPTAPQRDGVKVQRPQRSEDERP